MVARQTAIDVPEVASAEAAGPPKAVVRPAVWLSGQQAADHIGVSWPTLRQLILDHSIPHVRIGRRWKIEVSVLDDHLRRLASDSAGRV